MIYGRCTYILCTKDAFSILAGRRINDDMGGFVAATLVKKMLKQCIQVNGSKVLILGLTFKENCPDLRNTRVIDVIRGLEDFGVTVEVHDPMVDAAEAQAEYGIDLVDAPEPGRYDGLVAAVSHTPFVEAGIEWARDLMRDEAVIYDLKGIYPDGAADLTL